MQVKNSSDFIYGIPILCVVPVWRADVSKQGKTQVDEHFIFDTLKICICFFGYDHAHGWDDECV